MTDEIFYLFFFVSQDPAVRKAAAATPANRGMEDYNPFAEPSSQGATQVRGAANPPIYGGVGATPIPATLQPTTQEVPPPAYARTPQQTIPTANLGSTLSPSAEVKILILNSIKF